MALQSKLTLWIGAEDEPEITREDQSVQIQVIGDQTVEILLAPELFPALRAAMNAAETTYERKGRL